MATGPAGSGPDPSTAAARLAIDLRPGRPDLSSFPRTEWASSVRRALSAAPYESLDYTEPTGLPALRAAVADYVARILRSLVMRIFLAEAMRVIGRRVVPWLIELGH